MLNPYNFYRLANFLYRKHIPVLPKLIDYFVRWTFACWLSHTARIGKGLVLGYGGLGVVFNSRCTIGDNVEVGQGVTIGGNATKYGILAIMLSLVVVQKYWDL